MRAGDAAIQSQGIEEKPMSRKAKKQRRPTKRSTVKPSPQTQQQIQVAEQPSPGNEAQALFHSHMSVTFHFAATVTDALGERSAEKPLLSALLQTNPPKPLLQLLLGKIID